MTDSTGRGKGYVVLIVEDHEPTARILRTVLEETTDTLSTLVVGDGEACFDVLEDADGPCSDLILLDLGLPEINGHAVLAKMQAETSMRRIPTIVFSNSDDQETIQQCYDGGANAFISKPGDLDKYETVAKRITDFWFCTATKPAS